MKIPRWLSSIFEPSAFSNLNFDDIQIALQDPSVRKHWLMTMLDEVRGCHSRTHVALTQGKLHEKFVQESARLQGLDWALRQILNSKTSVELDRHHNHTGNPHEGVAVHPI